MDINPWQVESIQDFSFLKCPECTFDTKDEDTFQDHATESHPLSFVLFKKTSKDEYFEDLYTIEEHILDIAEAPDNETKPENFLLSTMIVEESSNKPEDSENQSNQVQIASDKEECFEDPLQIKEENLNVNIAFKKRKLSQPSAHSEGIDIKSIKVEPNFSASNHKKIKTFKCQIDSCVSRYVDKRSLKKHMEKVHSVLSEEKRLFNCSTCGYVGNSKLQLKLHIDDVHEGKKLKPLLCTICGFRGTCPAALKFHTQNVHEGKKPHVCNTCGKGFGTSFHLNEHISTVHEKIKSHQCPLCGKSFGVKHNLDNHIRGVHEKNKPHKCTFCEYASTNRFQLQNHLKEVHEGNKPFACSLCNSKFGLKFRLNRHIKEVHEKQNRQTCSLCSSTFSHIGNLNAHIASVHEGKSSKKNNKKNKILTE